MLRVSRRQRIEDTITKLDAFPKVEADVLETSSSGGAVSILAALLITGLVIGEFRYYRTVDVEYEYKVDLGLEKVARHTTFINSSVKFAIFRTVQAQSNLGLKTDLLPGFDLGRQFSTLDSTRH